MDRWTEEDIISLKSIYPTYPMEEIIAGLGRSRSAIKSKACRLDIEHRPNHTEEGNRAISAAKKGKHPAVATEFKPGQVPWNKGKMRFCPWMAEVNKRPESRQRERQNLAERRESPEFQRERFKGLVKRPNKVEAELWYLLRKWHLPFRYVGAGEVVLGGKCPDFININGKKQIIELFGTYWHDTIDVAKRTEHFRRYGFSTLIVWEDELKNTNALEEKVRAFEGGA